MWCWVYCVLYPDVMVCDMSCLGLTPAVTRAMDLAWLKDGLFL